MRVAVIGAGLAGLSVCYYLLEKGFQVTLFDKKDVGAGASGAASGLLHPYVGQKGLRSQFADEALIAAKELLRVAQQHTIKRVFIDNGIYRLDWHNPPFDNSDIAHCGATPPGFGIVQTNVQLITSGITVFMEPYLEGLFQHLVARGLRWMRETISSLEPIEGHDQTVLAMGSGIQHFHSLQFLPVKFIKGQALVCRMSRDMPKGERSVIGNGHVTLTQDPEILHLGSTYEHVYDHPFPDMEVAKQYLVPRIGGFFPHWQGLDIIDCKAGIRVCRKDGYLPLIHRLQSNVWAITALGSRGLLYAALYGRNQANLIESRL